MIELDERIRRYLAKCPPAVSGSDGHGATFKVARALVNGFALDPAEALRYLTIYNAECSPPWSPRELRHKVDQAGKTASAKPLGHLLGAGANRPTEAVQGCRELVPVRLEPKKSRFGTVGTLLFYTSHGARTPAHTCKTRIHKQASPASQPDAPTLDLPETDGRACVPGCAARRPQEIVCSDATWRAVAAHPLGDEPAVHLALWLFGPDATVLSTGEEAP